MAGNSQGPHQISSFTRLAYIHTYIHIMDSAGSRRRHRRHSRALGQNIKIYLYSSPKLCASRKIQLNNKPWSHKSPPSPFHHALRQSDNNRCVSSNSGHGGHQEYCNDGFWTVIEWPLRRRWTPRHAGAQLGAISTT